MMYDIRYGSQYKKSYKRVKKRAKPLEKLHQIIELLANEEPLPQRCRDHMLIGNHAGSRECHIEPDWLLIYRIEDGVLILEDTGSHSDLFA